MCTILSNLNNNNSYVFSIHVDLSGAQRTLAVLVKVGNCTGHYAISYGDNVPLLEKSTICHLASSNKKLDFGKNEEKCLTGINFAVIC